MNISCGRKELIIILRKITLHNAEVLWRYGELLRKMDIPVHAVWLFYWRQLAANPIMKMTASF